MDYLSFFGFKDAPFRLTPDPDFFFPSHSHQEALQTLLYSIRAGEGFIQITGDPGTGKTLLLRTMLKELGDDVQTALILNPNLSPQDLLRVILDDFAITSNDQDISSRPKDQLIRLFRDFLLLKADEGCRAVIIVDEAQNLPLETIEELRLLSNLETDKKKLLQIFLVGQRELESKIEDPGLRQLSQRITIRYCLRPFNRLETTTYIGHRLKIAAPSNPAIFAPEIIDLIYKFSQGTPRLINILCERILIAAYIDGQTTMGRDHYDKAVLSIMGEAENKPLPDNKKKTSTLRNTLLIILALTIAAGFSIFYQQPQRQKYLKSLLTKIIADADTVKKETAPKVTKISSKQDLNGKKSEKALPELQTTEDHKITDKISTNKQETSNPEFANKKAVNPAPAFEKNHVSAPDRADKNPDMTKKSPAARTLPAIKKLPAIVVGLPAKFSLLVARKGELMTDLWCKDENHPTPVITRELPLPPNLRPGLFIAGINKDKAFLFNQFNFIHGAQPQLPDSWTAFLATAAQPVIPLIILPSTSNAVTPPATTAEIVNPQSENQIMRTINDWATAWHTQNLEKFMEFYAPVMTIYEPGRLKPLTFEKDRLKEIKAALFKKTSSLSLTISAPFCILDPSNPNLAMAFFFQDYQSNLYQDKGYKTLFLNHIRHDKEPDRWQISGKFFVPVE